MSQPKIAPLTESDWNEEQEEIIQPFVQQQMAHNVFTTLLHHPALFRRWLVFARHILGKSTLSVRDRELLILRVAHCCDSPYEWAQHVMISRKAGLPEGLPNIAKADPASDDLDGNDGLLLRATDELLSDTRLSDGTWESLAERYETQQILDIIFTVGQYNMLAMALNSVGVEVDEGL